jgi:hypothetical protein
MAKKLLPNRISKTVALDALTKVRQAIQLLLEVIGEDTPMTEAEYKALQKMADKRKQACDDVLTVMQEHPKMVIAPLNTVEIRKDKGYYELCDQIDAMLANVLIRLKREQNIAGAEYANACSVFETDMEAKVLRGDTEAQIVQQELKAISRTPQLGNIKSPTTPTKTA